MKSPNNSSNSADMRKVLFALIVGIFFGIISNKLSTWVWNPQEYETRYGIRQFALSKESNNKIYQNVDNAEDDFLKDKVKILCWVATFSNNHQSKAKHVKATWGKRCNRLIFMSDTNDTELGAIDIKIPNGREYLWGKTKASFKYIYDHHFHEYDWFFKADDDTYAIMENMRYLLTAYNTSDPLYLGCKFKEFMSGGAGYILSKAALKLFMEVGRNNGYLCQSGDLGAEDVFLGRCLGNLGVISGDTRDHLGRGRFFPVNAIIHLMDNLPTWYYDLTAYEPHRGLNCCSDTAVTFHYVDISKMYEMEYFLYHLRPFGSHRIDTVPAPFPPDLKSIPNSMLKNANTTAFTRSPKENNSTPTGK